MAACSETRNIPEDVWPGPSGLPVHSLALLTGPFHHCSLWLLEAKQGHVTWAAPEPGVLLQCLSCPLPSVFTTGFSWVPSSRSGCSSAPSSPSRPPLPHFSVLGPWNSTGYCHGPYSRRLPGSSYHRQAATIRAVYQRCPRGVCTGTADSAALNRSRRPPLSGASSRVPSSS